VVMRVVMHVVMRVEVLLPVYLRHVVCIHLVAFEREVSVVHLHERHLVENEEHEHVQDEGVEEGHRTGCFVAHDEPSHAEGDLIISRQVHVLPLPLVFAEGGEWVEPFLVLRAVAVLRAVICRRHAARFRVGLEELDFFVQLDVVRAKFVDFILK